MTRTARQFASLFVNINGTDAEAEAPIFWLRDAKSQLTGKDLDAGRD